MGSLNDFAGKTALVTGGASGIGLACVRGLLARGSKVMVADISPFSAALLSEAAEPKQLDSFEIDVRSPAACARMVERTKERLGSPDILIHCAGIGIEKNFLETTPEEWQQIIDIDLTGTFNCCQAVARSMVEVGRGRIVTIASTAGVVGSYRRAAYSAAKGGVIALTRVMATELGPLGITVNTLAPGAIDTELVAKMHSPQTRQIYTDRIPIARYGTSEETADVALFLASDAARYVNGHVMAVDGGFLAAGLMQPSSSL